MGQGYNEPSKEKPVLVLCVGLNVSPDILLGPVNCVAHLYFDYGASLLLLVPPAAGGPAS